MASHPPRPKQPCGGPGQSAAAITLVTPATGTGEQRPLLRVLAGAGRTHRWEVADEISRAGDQLDAHRRQAPKGQAADEVELVPGRYILRRSGFSGQSPSLTSEAG